MKKIVAILIALLLVICVPVTSFSKEKNKKHHFKLIRHRKRDRMRKFNAGHTEFKNRSKKDRKRLSRHHMTPEYIEKRQHKQEKQSKHKGHKKEKDEKDNDDTGKDSKDNSTKDSPVKDETPPKGDNKDKELPKDNPPGTPPPSPDPSVPTPAPVPPPPGDPK